MTRKAEDSSRIGVDQCAQDDLILDYLDSMFGHGDLDAKQVVVDKTYAPVSSIRNGLELEKAIDLKAILSGDRQPTPSQALMILLLNIRLLRSVSRASRLAEFILQVSDTMVQRLNLMTMQQDLLIKAVKSGAGQRQ
jgi:hypothetical protein